MRRARRPAIVPARRPAIVPARVLAVLLACASGLGMFACGSVVPLPPLGVHSGDEMVIVPFPPPPPQVDIVPKMPENKPDLVWVDGQWKWSGRRWEWQKGQWETAPKDATYAPPTIVYLPNRQIAWFAGRWNAGGSR